MRNNKFLVVGLTGLLLVGGLLLAGCLTFEFPEPPLLADGAWSPVGNIVDKETEYWYQFPVVSGTEYYVWVREHWTQSVTLEDGWADVVLSARYDNNTGPVIFKDAHEGNGRLINAKTLSFTANKTGNVYLRVHSYKGILGVTSFGKFRVAYSTAGSRPYGEM